MFRVHSSPGTSSGPSSARPEAEDGLLPSETAVDTLDQEDFQPSLKTETKKKPIVSVHGQDVKEEDIDKAA